MLCKRRYSVTGYSVRQKEKICPLIVSDFEIPTRLLISKKSPETGYRRFLFDWSSVNWLWSKASFSLKEIRSLSVQDSITSSAASPATRPSFLFRSSPIRRHRACLLDSLNKQRCSTSGHYTGRWFKKQFSEATDVLKGVSPTELVLSLCQHRQFGVILDLLSSYPAESQPFSVKDVVNGLTTSERYLLMNHLLTYYNTSTVFNRLLSESLLRNMAEIREVDIPQMLECLKRWNRKKEVKIDSETVCDIFRTFFSRVDTLSSCFRAREVSVELIHFGDKIVVREVFIHLLQECDLRFEYFGYQSDDHNILEPPRHSVSGPFGNRFLALLNSEILHLTCEKFDAVSEGMTPHLTRYSMNLVLLSQMRLAREKGLENYFPDMFGRYKNTLELVSHVHFKLKLGNAYTTKVLLERCFTPMQIRSVMQLSDNSGVSNTLLAVEKIIKMNTSYRVFFVIRRRAGGNITFDVRADKIVDESFEHREALEENSLSYFKTHLKPIKDNIWVKKEILFWLSNHNLDEALDVVSRASSMNIIPTMDGLVCLLEYCVRRPELLSRCITHLNEEYSSVAPAVYRSFIERVSVKLSTSDTESSSENTFTIEDCWQLLHLLSQQGALQASLSGTRRLIEKHPEPFTRQLVSSLKDATYTTDSPIPLHVDSVGLVTSSFLRMGEQLSVDVVCQSSEERPIWWSSNRTSSSSLPTHLFSISSCALWESALTVLSTDTLNLSWPDRTRAFYVLAFGCPHTQKVVEFLSKMASFTSGDERWYATRLERSRRDASLSKVLGISAEVFRSSGDWELALRMLPEYREDLPFIIKVSILRATSHSPSPSVSNPTQRESLSEHNRRRFTSPAIRKLASNSKVGERFYCPL